jgi:phosphoribosylformylglycinamidine cyclo-ligase
MQENLPIGEREAYGNLNMGAGFALYLPAEQAAAAVAVARAAGVAAWRAGAVEAGAKQVMIEPLSLVFGEDELHVRV